MTISTLLFSERKLLKTRFLPQEAQKIKNNAKTGTVKGSFRAFGTNGKSISVTIAGVTINGVGYGVAYAKKTTFSTITIR